jgi:protein-tyrosine-phosphatase
MAAGLFNAAAARERLPVRALSCGISAFAPLPATPAAVRAAAHYGADISAHQAQPVTETLLSAAERVYCLTRGHLDVLELMFPAQAGRLTTLGAADIPDPFGGTDEEYAAVCRQIQQAVEKLVRQMGKDRAGKDREPR